MLTGQLIALAAAFALDLIFADPPNSAHIIAYIGKTIACFERALRRAFSKTARGELWAGALLAAVTPLLFGALAFLLLWACYLLHPYVAIAIETLLCWQCLAMRSLQKASMKVAHAIEKGELDTAREALSMIVGRDTAVLDKAGITRAAIETVAENTSDGVVAPLFYMALFGAVGGIIYKTVNTLDSMVGYKNDNYLFFGRASARLDDVFNFIPSRLTALVMILVSGNASGAWRIWRRDRRNHKSPNSAQSESACAGALGIRLGGSAYYFGKLVEKPFIGDALRPVETGDIRRANRIMFAVGFSVLILFSVLKGLILWL
jgi:adenosylcobinamide-phosphate synthase